MKLVTYRPNGSGAPTVGVLAGGRIVPATHALVAAGEDPAHAATMERFIQLPRAAQAKAAAAAASKDIYSDTLETARLEAPILRPSKIIGLGYNYRALCTNEGVTPGAHPELFVKMPTSVVGATDPVVVPAVIDKVDFEAELGVVIGRTCHAVTPEEALEYVAGYTVINDVTAKIIPRPPESGSVVLALKGVDTFCPTGPCLVTPDEIPNPQDLTIRCRVNGVEKQNFNSSDMVHSIAEIISYVSARMTLEPGDMFSTGTSLGIGIIQKPPVFIEDGDVVECEVDGIGVIRNEFILRHVRG